MRLERLAFLPHSANVQSWLGYGRSLLANIKTTYSDIRTASRMRRAASTAAQTPEEEVLRYHEASKHHLNEYADGPHGLTWTNQPDPFRRYKGAPTISLPLPQAGAPAPPYDATLFPSTGSTQHPVNTGQRPPHHQPASLAALSHFLYTSFALSAWKQAGGERWSLRVNPSSGNLHPTECYILSGPLPGVSSEPFVAHYSPEAHALELRASIPPQLWQELLPGAAPGSFLLGLTSVHWREAWKYGVRAYRYCQHDVGHALAAAAVAAAGLGWQAVLLDGVATEDVGRLLGVLRPAACEHDPEREHPDCMVLISPNGASRSAHPRALGLPESASAAFAGLHWHGVPNRLSKKHVNWPGIEAVAAACVKPSTSAAPQQGPGQEGTPGEASTSGRQLLEAAVAACPTPLTVPELVHRRRSALGFDGVSNMPAAHFFRMLARTLATGEAPPWSLVQGAPSNTSLLLFVHKVQGIEPGLYFLDRSLGRHTQELSQLKQPYAGYTWRPVSGAPEGLPLFHLVSGDAREIGQRLSCHQDIGADGAFCVAMVSEFTGPIAMEGAWMYPRLFWETGIIGQVLYLEAEALGWRGTGIGCFFDNPSHQLLNVRDHSYQSLYHFAVGRPVEDPRISSLPPYHHLAPAGPSHYSLRGRQ